MSFKIEEKILTLSDCPLNEFKPKYKYVPSKWVLISIILFMIGYIFMYSFLGISTNLEGEYIKDGIHISGIYVFYILSATITGAILIAILGGIVLHYVEYKKIFILSYLEVIQIEKELDKEFGSVDKILKKYIEMKALGIELSDDNIYEFLEESNKIRTKRNRVKNTSLSKIENIDIKINKLIKKKTEIALKYKGKERDILDLSLA